MNINDYFIKLKDILNDKMDIQEFCRKLPKVVCLYRVQGIIFVENKSFYFIFHNFIILIY